MSDEKHTSPLLEGLVIGKPISSHDGICCCPALKESTDEKYIVKIISVPGSQVQIDALILTGACKDQAEALEYFRNAADEIIKEAEFLNETAKLEGFLPFEGWQVLPMDDGRMGFEVSLLSTYKRSLERYMRHRPMTHLEAVNLGLDLCTALAICRRAGHLFVNLKPSNIFLTRNKEFRISDLGFVNLDSLAYASLPGKYRSAYSAPELRDDMTTLNTTVDTYAVGMILYQIYNDGNLPEEPRNPKDPFPCPANADYEISSVIMKAVDPDPEKRWQSPMEMGQALVGYMQRNTVNNVPIMPPSGFLPAKEETPVTPAPAAETAPAEQVVEETPAKEEAPVIPEAPEAPQPAAKAEAAEDAVTEETPDAPAAEPVEEIPAAPEAPEKAAVEEAPAEAPEEEADDLDFSIAFQNYEEPQTSEEKPEPRQISSLPVQRSLEKQERARKVRKTVALVLVLLLLCLAAAGGFWFYQTQYLQTIDDLRVEGTQDTLTVTVETDMDMSKLQVSCTDAYGNTTVQTLTDGKTTFTGLLPDSLYRVELTTESFHELQGKTAEIFTTNDLTNVAAISAVTGSEDGSVMVNFTVDGREPEGWVITCTAEGADTVTETFTGHFVTVKGLNPGTIYNLTLSASDGTPLLGEYSMDFLATNLVMAENLNIDSCVDGILSVSWNAPEGVDVENWTVRCYNDQGKEEVLEITGTEISFTGIDNSHAYTVEVIAKGMTNPARVSITEHPINITDLTVDTSAADSFTVNWEFTGEAPEGGWLLLYSFAGSDDQQSVVKAESNQVVIDNRIPGATYHFTIQAADSASVFNGSHSFTCPNAEIFEFEGMKAEKLKAFLVRTPDEEGWTGDSMTEEDFSQEFSVGDSISVVLKSGTHFFLPNKDISVLYVIRDGNGYVLPDYIVRETIDWKDLWYDNDYHVGEMDLPKVPAEAGSYNVCIYFNNQAITSIDFYLE